MAQEDVVWVADLLFSTALSESEDIAEQQFIQIERKAQLIFSKYYKILTARGTFMDVEAPHPGLDVDWAPISRKWASYKAYVLAGRPKGKGSRKAMAATGSLNRYYFGISAKTKKRPSLVSFLARRDPFKDFGTPRVSLFRSENVKRGIQLNRNNQPYYTKRKFGRGFAKRSEAFDITFLAEIEGFRDIDGMSEYGILGKLGSGQLAGIMRTLEFGGKGIKGSRVPARPLLIPYLRWFMDNGFRQLMGQI